MTETQLRDQICRFGRSLFERGLTPGSSGNISVRLDDGGWLVTPTNASLVVSGGRTGIGTASPSAMLHVAGNVRVSGRIRTGSCACW